MARHRRVALGLLAASAALAGCVSLPTAQPSPRLYPRVDFGETTLPPRPVAFLRRGTLPKVPQALPMLKVQELSPEARRQLMVRLFRLLPVSLPEAELKAELARLETRPLRRLASREPLEAQLGDWHVTVWPEGQFAASRDYRRSAPGPLAPREATVQAVADALLPRLKPLLPEPVTFIGVGDAEREYGEGPMRVTSRYVSYQARKNGIPLGHVSITVAAGPTIVRVSSHLRRTVADGEAPLLSPEEALHQLERGEGRVGGDYPGGAATAYVDSVALLYEEPGPVRGVSHLMPLYVFRGQAIVTGRPPGTWGGSLEAVRPERLEPGPGRSQWPDP